MSAEDEGKTESATTKQRQKFREEGSVAKSNELNAFAQFLVGYAMLGFTGAGIALGLGELMVFAFGHFEGDLIEDVYPLAALYAERLVVLILPVLFALVVASLAVSRAQFDFMIAWKAIEPKWGKVNPFTNFKKVLISAHSLMELAKSIAKVTIISFMIYLAIAPLVPEFVVMYQWSPLQIGLKTWEVAKEIWLMIIFFLGVLGIADYAWQHHQLEEKMKMTKQEVKDEYKQQEPDPKIKQKIFQRGRQLIQRLMQGATAKADVVITNPTHYAVALAYKHGQMSAPKVVAKGMDNLALKMRKIAREKRVPIVENRGLARALYSSTEVGTEIPENLFKPVAEILAFIYKINKQKVGK